MGLVCHPGLAINLEYIEENDAHFYSFTGQEYGDNEKKPTDPPLYTDRTVNKKKQAGLKTTCVGLVDRSHEKTILNPLSG